MARLLRACACVVLFASILAGCGGKSQKCMGTERCDCYPNGTCNVGLACYSNVCVASAADAGADVATTGTGGSTTGTGGATDTGTGGSASAGGAGGVPAGTGGESLGTGGGPGGSGGGAGTSGAGSGGTAGRGTGGGGGGNAGTSGGGGTGTTIAATYNALEALGAKAETPVGAALDRAKLVLDADASAGPKYILFVTDGEPDFCDDGNTICPTDSVVAHLQALKAAGITTLIFGVQNAGTTQVPLQTLQAFANAGAGQPVAALTTPVEYTADQCNGVAAYKAEQTAAGKAMRVPLGTYATTGGTAMVYKPNPGDRQALVNLLGGTIAGLKSCSFDLVNGLSVDLSKIDQAQVLIEGQNIARSDTNGWRMVSATRLELTGTACTLWRDPTTRSIDFQFPCGVVTGN